MVTAKFKKEIITEDADQFNIPRSIEATLYNVGEAGVEIEELGLESANTFRIGASGVILEGTTISIKFIDESTAEYQPIKKLILFYNAPTNC